MAEVITYLVKSVKHGDDDEIPNAKRVTVVYSPAPIIGGGDDKQLPVLDRPGMGPIAITVEAEDDAALLPAAIALGTKASLVWKAKTLTGERTYTAINMVYHGPVSIEHRTGTEANLHGGLFRHESADGTTWPITAT